MRQRELRLLILSTLRPDPDFSQLAALRGSSNFQRRTLLRWLDQSGLALYLFDHLQDHDALGCVPEDFVVALGSRLVANRKRTLAMIWRIRALDRILSPK